MSDKKKLEKDMEFTAEIIDAALPKNWSVTKYEGLTVFIPGDGVVGDVVKVRIVQNKRDFSYGEIVELITPSPYRTESPCPHFGICGGCIFQNLTYEKQLELKVNYLFHSLKTIGNVKLDNVEVEPAVSSPDLYSYRNKMEFSFGTRAGELVLGMRERNSPFKRFAMQVFPIEQCLIFSKHAGTIISIVMDFLRERNYPAYNVFKKTGFLRNLLVREGKRTGQIMVGLVTRSGEIEQIELLYRQLKDAVPELTSFYWIRNDKPANALIVDEVLALFGESYIEEELHGLRFRVYPETFFQPNTKGAEILYATLGEWAQLTPNARVLGLYCGSGSIELFLSRYVSKVLGVDSHPVNIETAEHNARINNISNCTFECGRVEDVLRDFPTHEYDYIVIDPPRSGLTPKAVKRICAFDIPRIMYVSCSPSTLSRDLSALSEYGYHPVRLKPFDFFPQTAHLETLVLLQKD